MPKSLYFIKSLQIWNMEHGVTGYSDALESLCFDLTKSRGLHSSVAQEPLSGVASRVFPKFHLGSNAANAAAAGMGVKLPVQFWDMVRDARDCNPPNALNKRERSADLRIVTN
jgi:hypothetical protein